MLLLRERQRFLYPYYCVCVSIVYIVYFQRIRYKCFNSWRIDPFCGIYDHIDPSYFNIFPIWWIFLNLIEAELHQKKKFKESCWFFVFVIPHMVVFILYIRKYSICRVGLRSIIRTTLGAVTSLFIRGGRHHHQQHHRKSPAASRRRRNDFLFIWKKMEEMYIARSIPGA